MEPTKEKNVEEILKNLKIVIHEDGRAGSDFNEELKFKQAIYDALTVEKDQAVEDFLSPDYNPKKDYNP